MKTFLLIASNSDGHEPIGEYTESEIPDAIAADYSARTTDEFCPEEYILWQRGPDGRYIAAKFIPPGGQPMVRLANENEWQDSISTGLKEFRASPGEAREITTEEGEP